MEDITVGGWMIYGTIVLILGFFYMMRPRNKRKTR